MLLIFLYTSTPHQPIHEKKHEMEETQYTVPAFHELFGKCGVIDDWTDAIRVIVTDINEQKKKVAIFFKTNKSAKFKIVFHENEWKVHGLYRETSGFLNTKIHYINGQRHRDHDLPAEISQDKHGRTYRRWFQRGQAHRDGDLPAFQATHPNGNVSQMAYYKRGQLHRNGDLPATIRINSDGVIIERRWFKYGLKHRDDDLPADMYASGRVSEQSWWKNGELHRDNNLPARVMNNFDRDDIKKNEQSPLFLTMVWVQHNKRHREGGLPAMETYNEDGELVKEEWFLNGVKTDAPPPVEP